MKKLLSLVLAAVLLLSFSACDVSEEVAVKEKLSILLDGYPVEILEEMLNKPQMIMGENVVIKTTGDGAGPVQAELDEIYKDVAEPGKVVDIYMGTDLMGLWMLMLVNEATFSLKEVEITDMPSDSTAAYTAVITVTQSGGGTAEAEFSGTVQLNDDGLISSLKIASLDEVYTAVGVDPRLR